MKLEGQMSFQGFHIIALFSKILDTAEILKPLTCCASLFLGASKLRPLLSERDDTAFFSK